MIARQCAHWMRSAFNSLNSRSWCPHFGHGCIRNSSLALAFAERDGACPPTLRLTVGVLAVEPKGGGTNASANSVIDMKRSAGFLASAFMQSSSSHVASSRRRVDGADGTLVRTWAQTTAGGPSKGGDPVS